MADFSAYFTWQEESEWALWPLLVRALISSMWAPPAWPDDLPKVLPPNTITLGSRVQHRSFGENKHSVHYNVLRINAWILKLLSLGNPTSSNSLCCAHWPCVCAHQNPTHFKYILKHTNTPLRIGNPTISEVSEGLFTILYGIFKEVQH